MGGGLDDYKNLKFLNISKIPDFDTLHELFFNILAKPLSDLHRSGSKFAYLPYLNSSIFTKQEIEKTLEINQLENGVTIQIYAHTSLFDEKHKKLTGEMPFLQYLFEFLDSFDFGENHSDENKSDLISSAVLGQVFERLNGYKDGSFYTPSFITSYMSKASIDKLVLAKFSEFFGVNLANLDDLEDEINAQIRKSQNRSEIYKALNSLIDSLKICDPAVGSGYFLVSALNYIIFLKSKLGILIDENAKPLKVEISYKFDELIVCEYDGSIIRYSRPTSQTDPRQIIQKTLFNEKAKLIENCLFGVDINPNSCEIARLRLWIELLKSSYFTDLSEPNPLKQNALETLPNIDINIKCGNSLVSYFDLKRKFTIPNITHRINEYKHKVNLYKAGFGDKVQISNEIKNLQATFKNLCFANEYKEKVKKFKSECDKYSQKYGDYLAKDDLRLARYVSNSFFVEFDENEAKKDFAKLLKLYDETFSLDNLNPFEWRFEFPEILDENGDFMGFDLIIANPPYMQVPKGVFSLKFFPYSEGKDKGKQNTYKVFIEQAYNLVKPQGEVALITQSSIMCDLSATYTRELLLTKTQIHEFVEFPKNISIFTNVIQGVCILRFENSKPNSQSEFKISIHNDPTKIKKLEFESVKQKDILRFFPANFEIPLIKQGEMAVINKLKTDNEILKNLLSDSLQGNINTIHLKRIESSEPTDYFIVKGANIHRYYLDDNFKFAKITDETTKLVQENKKFPVALVSQNITWTSDKFRIHSTIVLSKNTNFVFLDTANILYLQCATQAKYLLALLNSKVLDWLFRKTSTNNHVNLYELINLPIPQITPKNQILADKIINLVDKILKETDENERAKLSGEIDKLVYQIYDLTADEIALIENA